MILDGNVVKGCTCLLVAHTLHTLGGGCHDDIRRIITHNGNGLLAYESCLHKLASFFTMYPQCRTVLPMWMHRAQHDKRDVASVTCDQSQIAHAPSPVAKRLAGIDYWDLGSWPQPPQAKKPCLVDMCSEATYARQRTHHFPSDPWKLAGEFNDLQTKCEAGLLCRGRQFVIVPADPATMRWHFWQTLAKVGVLVLQHFEFTCYAHLANAFAGIATSGQEVVYTPAGTVVWFSDRGRILVPFPAEALLRRLAVVFPSIEIAALPATMLAAGFDLPLKPPPAESTSPWCAYNSYGTMMLLTPPRGNCCWHSAKMHSICTHCTMGAWINWQKLFHRFHKRKLIVMVTCTALALLTGAMSQ